MTEWVTKSAIWTGDTTSHGGTLHDGIADDTYMNTNRAVLVGHKFWCPKCMCWSEFIEGCSRYSVHGRNRVLEGHKASCGAYAIHRQSIPYFIDDLAGTGKSGDIAKRNEARETAQSNQSKNGGYSHSFGILPPGEDPLGYVIFNKGNLLDIGTASKNSFSGSGSYAKVTTNASEAVYLAVKAPPPRLK